MSHRIDRTVDAVLEVIVRHPKLGAALRADLVSNAMDLRAELRYELELLEPMPAEPYLYAAAGRQ